MLQQQLESAENLKRELIETGRKDYVAQIVLRHIEREIRKINEEIEYEKAKPLFKKTLLISQARAIFANGKIVCRLRNYKARVLSALYGFFTTTTS